MQAVSSKHDFELALQQAGMEPPRRHGAGSDRGPDGADARRRRQTPSAYTVAPAGA